jgi:hypothetical protein
LGRDRAETLILNYMRSGRGQSGSFSALNLLKPSVAPADLMISRFHLELPTLIPYVSDTGGGDARFEYVQFRETAALPPSRPHVIEYECFSSAPFQMACS